MRFLLAFILLSAATLSAHQATLTPQLSCWFLTYPSNTQHSPNQGRALHLVLGYANQATSNQVIHVQRQAALGDAPKNIITPPDYNGLQPDVFKVGAHPLVLDLGDTRNLVRTGAQNVTWSLGLAKLIINAASLRADNRCDQLYGNHCPVRMTGFCEDGSYCNGRETCEANFVHTSVGQERFGFCRNASAPLQCGAGRMCSEHAMACVDSLLTSAPIDAVRTTPKPTVAPLATCKNNTECSAGATFCRGVPSCRYGRCRYNISYSPCAAGQLCQQERCVPRPTLAVADAPTDANTTLVISTEGPPSGSCSTDADCAGHGSFCTGTANCTAGVCVLPTNYTACDPDELCTSQGCVGASTRPCTNQSDCDDMATFCRGAATCTEGLCLFNESYVRCPPVTNVESSVHEAGILATICSEEQQACLTYYYCLSDADCDDGLFCTGTETCADAVCHEGTRVVCNDTSRACTESHQCGDVLLNSSLVAPSAPSAAPTSSPNNNTAVMVFSIVFPVIVLLLLLILILYFIAGQMAKRRSIQSELSASAVPSMNSRLNSRKK